MPRAVRFTRAQPEHAALLTPGFPQFSGLIQANFAPKTPEINPAKRAYVMLKYIPIIDRFNFAVFGTKPAAKKTIAAVQGPTDFEVLEAQRAAKRARKIAAAAAAATAAAAPAHAPAPAPAA
ncbi:hypothetical protein DFH09DRAFT_1075229 [Mycena vulgaris]|nr:hypothetical protein DFH09DRAFT_1075229 [Mycena vulgaris]